MTDLNTYFQKHGLCAENILYIYEICNFKILYIKKV